jgi:hypothetical protein
MQLGNKIVYSRKIDWFFLIFPVWLPILFLSTEYLANDYGAYVTFIFLFLIGEAHFVATLFFFTSENREYILDRKKSFIYYPIFLLSLNAALFFYNIKFALILGGALSAWHVTRQSVGISRLFTGRNRALEFDIYVISLLSVVVGFFRSVELYLDSVPEIFTRFIGWIENDLFKVSLITLILACLIRRIYLNRSTLTVESVAIYFIGCTLYMPYIFIDPLLAAIIGVSMHWSQYLTLVYTISARNGNLSKLKSKFLSVRIWFVILLFLIVIFVSDFARVVEQNLLPILLIPLSIQLLHYYYDGLIWKGSDPYLRENVFKRIFL